MADKSKPIAVLAEHIVTPGGEAARRLVFDVPGHDVQVIQFDDSDKFIVFVDNAAEHLEADEVLAFIRGRLGE